MHRHLLTLFALFTGLAAVHAPAHASALETFVYDARALAKSSDGAAQQDCNCPSQEKAGDRQCPGKQPSSKRISLPAILRGPVLMGVERSIE